MNPEKRIYGIETEFPVMTPVATGAPTETLSTNEVSVILSNLPEGMNAIHSAGAWLQNGSKYYTDIRALEYATAETTSAKDAVTCSLAGLKIIASGLSQHNDTHGTDYKIYKRAIDRSHLPMASGFSLWGSHHNISANAEKMKIDEYHLYPLALHLATMAIYSGAGAIDERTGRNAQFVLEQRAPGLKQDFSDSPVASKQPLVHLRKQSLTTRHDMNRVHITSINPNWSPWAERMAIGTSALLLGLIEDGYCGEDLMVDEVGSFFKQPLVNIAKTVAYDTHMNTKIRLAKKQTTAIEIQSQLLDHVLHRNAELTEENKWTIEQWGQVLDDAYKWPERLADRVAWAARYIDLTKVREENKLSWSDQDLIARDYSWDEVQPNGEAGELAKNISLKDRPTEKDILHAAFYPPQDTRAKIRGDTIRKSDRNLGFVRWNSFAIDSHIFYDTGDPFDNGD